MSKEVSEQLPTYPSLRLGVRVKVGVSSRLRFRRSCSEISIDPAAVGPGCCIVSTDAESVRWSKSFFPTPTQFCIALHMKTILAGYNWTNAILHEELKSRTLRYTIEIHTS